MVKKLYLMAIVTIIIFSNGCGVLPPIVRSHVTSFHNITGKIERNTIAVLPFDKSQENSLQFQTYAAIIASFLERSGFSIANKNQEPDYFVLVSYGIGSGKLLHRVLPLLGKREAEQPLIQVRHSMPEEVLSILEPVTQCQPMALSEPAHPQ